jgi:hypothetical protein
MQVTMSSDSGVGVYVKPDLAIYNVNEYQTKGNIQKKKYLINRDL